MNEIRIKKTAKHPAGSKYLQMAASGPLPANVEVKTAQNGKLEAYIDDEAIGFLKVNPDDMPDVFELKILGVDPSDTNSFVAEVKSASGQKKQPETKSNAIEDEKNKIVSEGIMTMEELSPRVDIAVENGVKESVIVAGLKKFRKYNDALHVPSALYQNMRTEGEESILNQALIAALTRSALIFAGEKSTGKNVCAETVAFVLGRPFYRINFEKDMILEDVFGSKTTDNSAAEKLELELAKAKLKVELAKDSATEEDIEKAAMFELLKAQSACIRLIQATSDIIRWAKEGGVMLFDEVNMANANILQTVMNSTADGEKTLIVPGVENIKLNPDCVLLAGMNPGYAGTFELNTATKSRCGFINFDFPKSIKPQLMANFSKDTCLKKKHFQICDDFYKDMRIAVEHERVSNDCLNIRGFVNALKAVEMFPDATTLASQIEIFVINGCCDDDRGVLAPMLRDKVAI